MDPHHKNVCSSIYVVLLITKTDLEDLLDHTTRVAVQTHGVELVKQMTRNPALLLDICVLHSALHEEVAEHISTEHLNVTLHFRFG